MYDCTTIYIEEREEKKTTIDHQYQIQYLWEKYSDSEKWKKHEDKKVFKQKTRAEKRNKTKRSMYISWLNDRQHWTGALWLVTRFPQLWKFATIGFNYILDNDMFSRPDLE